MYSGCLLEVTYSNVIEAEPDILLARKAGI
jgi:hypothetical protein